MAHTPLLRRIHEPYERGESVDFQPLWDLIADDVVYESPAGPVHGRQAVMDYFDNAAETLDFWAFERPIEWYEDEAAERVVMRGEERMTWLATGETFRGQWIWIVDMPGGTITRIVHFLHFPEGMELVMQGLRAAWARTTATVAS